MRALLILLFFFFFLFPQPAYAHAFGNVYRMPIPLNLYLFGGAGALVVSFFLIGYFANKSQTTTRYPECDITSFFLVRLFTNTIVVQILKIMSVFLLFLCIISGFFGTQIITYNINMTFFWVIFIVGFPYLTFLFGNIWSCLNPWKVIIEWVEKLTDLPFTGFVAYPGWFASYPAFFGYFLLICFEIIFERTPFVLSTFLLLYTNYSFFMALLFGKKNWEEHIDFFSVFFRYLSSLSIITAQKGKILLSPPFIGALFNKAADFSQLLFILFMLSSTATDGFMGTSVWFNLFYDVLHPIAVVLGPNAYQIMTIAALFLSPFLFLFCYLVALFIVKQITKTHQSLYQLSLDFAFSLLPIALVYHFAHYFVLLAVQGQDMLALISDPLGKGWNIFGTANFVSNPNILTVGVIWHSQVAAILIGHIAGVYLSHIDAVNLFKQRKAAFVSQFPLLVLMVFYTVLGLWILSQPITGQ